LDARSTGNATSLTPSSRMRWKRPERLSSTCCFIGAFINRGPVSPSQPKILSSVPSTSQLDCLTLLSAVSTPSILSVLPFKHHRPKIRMASTPLGSEFYPKQLYPKTAALYNEITGTATEDSAKWIIDNAIPPFTSDSVVHDNACGTGEVIGQVMASNPPSTILIKSTDINQYMVEGCKKRAEADDWPAKATVTAAEARTFPNNYFTHSFTIFITHLPDDGVTTIEHIYRTLKPGGTAVVGTWATMPHGEPLKRAHTLMRGADVPFPSGTPDKWYEASTLKDVMQKGGFPSDNVKMTKCDVFVAAKDIRHWVTILWSFLGSREDGWYQSDEDNWDKVIDMVVEDIKSGPYYSTSESGEVLLRFEANVAVATK